LKGKAQYSNGRSKFGALTYRKVMSYGASTSDTQQLINKNLTVLPEEDAVRQFKERSQTLSSIAKLKLTRKNLKNLDKSTRRLWLNEDRYRSSKANLRHL
jgi:hypothetical protein